MKKLVLLAGITTLAVYGHAQSRLSEQIGNVQSVTAIKSGYTLTLNNAFVNITAYNPTTVRFRITKQKPAEDFSYAIDSLTPNGTLRQAMVKSRDGNTIILGTDSLTLFINKNPFYVRVVNSRGEELCKDDSLLRTSWYGNQVSSYKKLHADEKFVGLGEKTGGLNRRGSYFRHWNSDIPGYALNQDPLYSTVPFFIGIHSNVVYGIFFDNTNQSYFNFGAGADEEIFHFGADDGDMNYYFFGGSTIAQILKDYTALTGRTPMPPLWSMGFQQSRWGYESQQQILDIARTFRDKKLPADVMVSDITYMDNYKIFTWNPTSFGNAKGMMQQIKQMGFDMVTIIDPGIKIEPGYKAYEEGVANGYFARYPDGRFYTGHVWPGRCHFPDFTRSIVRDWWGKSFKNEYVDYGIKGFWNDMNEPAAWGREFPNIIEFGEGKDKKTLFTVKNAYGSLMSKATYEGTRKLMNGQRPFVLTRAAYAGVQKYSAQWTGDNVSTDDHMLLGFRLLNSMGISGIPYVGMDIGGFMGNPTPELFVRWMSMGVYSPLFRNHTSIDFNYREPWLFGETNTRRIRTILEQRYKILPYLYSSFYQAHTTGLPVNRMLPLYHAFDKNIYDSRYENQFYFGDNLLVCPVASTREVLDVYLPGNQQWYRLSNDKAYTGNASYVVPSPLDDLPVFVKEGAIVPMQSVVQNTKEKGDGILYLHIWKSNKPSTFQYYEDDGETYNYEQGNYYKRLITYDGLSNKLMLEAKEGSYTSKFHTLKIILHGFNQTKDLTLLMKDTAMLVELQ